MWWLPAGINHQGHPNDDRLSWTSQYASLLITEWGDAALDGMNEAGLAAHALMYTSAVYEPQDQRPALTTTNWVRFVLDNFPTVAEAVAGLAAVRVTAVELLGQELGIHLAIEDSAGDSAIIEPINGRMVVHHGKQYQVMANSPALAQQQANLANYRPFGGELPPPGDITSLDRFARASYFMHYLPDPVDSRAAVASVLQVLTTVAKPPGAPYPDGDVYPTRWLSTVDLTNLDYYFWSRESPNLLWVSLATFAGESAVRSVDLFDPNLLGNIESQMLQG